jgi:membrane protein CcdC involved in cytochrome C biogenesis
MIFGKEVTEHKRCVLIFSTVFIWNISHSKKNSAIYCHKCENVFIWSTRYSCRILMKLWVLSTDFLKKFKYQISSKSFQWEPSCSMWTDERTDRQTYR